jgi:chemotaxis methyl-accepting protein methylase
MTTATATKAALGPAEASAFAVLAAEARGRFGAAFTPRGQGRLLAAVRARQARLGLAHLAAYGDALRADPGEWNNLWPLALFDGGAFFQPAPQFEVAGAVLREWAVGAPERTLRVLSLGCGAFETVSLAVLLEEAGFRHKNWQVEICGLDLNPEAAARAEAGFFSPEEAAGLTPGRRQKWFAVRAGGLVFKAALAPPVALAAGNAYEPETWPWAADSFDLIFCRGLTFEAPPEAPGRLAEIILSALTPAGFVFTAPGEFLPDVAGDFFLEERAGVTWYRRGSRRVKANRFHQPRRVKKEAEPAGPVLPDGPEVLPDGPEEAALLEAERLLASGRPDEARELAGEVILAAMNQGRPARAAWAFMDRWRDSSGFKGPAEPDL